MQAHVPDRLAGYKRPKYVVIADSLPKNPSGKILKRELRQAYAGLASGDPSIAADERWLASPTCRPARTEPRRSRTQ